MVSKKTRKLYIPRKELNLNYSFNGGQAYRWRLTADNSWIGVFAHRVWKLWQKDDYLFYEVSDTSVKDEEDEETLLKQYLRLEEPLSNLYQQWARCDPVFGKAAEKFEGVRMLRQDPTEIIFTFICSSNNSISRMKVMVEKICRLYGDRIGIFEGNMYYDFPAADKLTDGEVQYALETAKFGYRAKFIQQAAEKMIGLGGSHWVSKLCTLPYAEAKAELIQLPGIGAKVADCICLLSLNHLEAIPVDVHVFRIATTYYLPHLKYAKSVTDRVYNQIGDHFRSLFGKYAGWPHCVLFCDDLKEFKETSINKKRKTFEEGEKNSVRKTVKCRT